MAKFELHPICLTLGYSGQAKYPGMDCETEKRVWEGRLRPKDRTGHPIARDRAYDRVYEEVWRISFCLASHCFSKL